VSNKSKDKDGDSELRKQVIETLERHRSRALHVSEIRNRIGIDRSKHGGLHRFLERLAHEGQVTQLPGGRFRLRKKPPAGDPVLRESRPSHPRRPRQSSGGQLLTGRLQINVRGFGFVATDEPGADVFIPASGLHIALPGDRVRIRARSAPRGLAGRVVEVLERGTEFIAGQLRITRTGASIELDDERLRFSVRVVGELPKRAATGQPVIARIVEYPKEPEGELSVEIVETFDPAEIAEFELQRMLFREGVREDFPEDVQEEARALGTRLRARDKKGREDLRELALVTIDPEDARDHDDAVFANRLSDGGFRVVVAIADVSHYVGPGTALDREALKRGCTVYLPSRAIPMLPPELSSNLASLVPDRDRLALAVEVDLGPHGAIRSYRFIAALIRSHARLSYAGVARALKLTEKGRQQPAAHRHRELLETLLEVATVLGRRRRRRGSLNFELPEAKVLLDPESDEPTDVIRAREDPGIARAYNMIEELALLANEVVAADLSARKVPAIYRIHPEPDTEQVTAFCELAQSLGVDLDGDAAAKPKKLAGFLLQIKGTRHANILHFLLLRAMQQATYDTDNVGHFALASESYVHFTSPIRRYPDLAVHRIVRKVAQGGKAGGKELEEALTSQALQSSRRERRAMEMEREAVDLYRAMLMRDRIGESFEATITGVAEHGLYVSLDEPYVEVLCQTQDLPEDRYKLDRFGIELRGESGGLRFRLGDRLVVRLEEVSLPRRQLRGTPQLESSVLSGPRRTGKPRRARGQRKEDRQDRHENVSRRKKRPGAPRPSKRGDRRR
jgi:ribonuclease R